MFKRKRTRKIGLALGGGAVLGAAHVGVLRALDEDDIEISAVAGTSIGAFVGALYAFGKTWQDIESIARDLKWLDVSGLSLSQYGLLSNKKLGEKITDTIGEKKIQEAKTPLALVTTDIASGEKIVFTRGKVAKAVMASAAIPGIFKPVEHDTRFLVDGGVLENVPISPLQTRVDKIIAVDLNAARSFKKPENIIDVLLNTFYLNMKQITELQTKKADLLITPDLTDFNMVDTGQVSDLIAVGYEEAKKVLGKNFR